MTPAQRVFLLFRLAAAVGPAFAVIRLRIADGDGAALQQALAALGDEVTVIDRRAGRVEVHPRPAIVPRDGHRRGAWRQQRAVGLAAQARLDYRSDARGQSSITLSRLTTLAEVGCRD